MTADGWRRLEAILEGASQLPATEQQAYIDQACGSDQELRAQIEAVRQHEERDDDTVTEAVRQAALLIGPTAERWQERRIGPYLLEQPIGRGGMATVWRAVRDASDFHQQVAIKFIHAELLHNEGERFRRERQILAQMAHPNVARILDGGTTEDGIPYYVMEFIEGEPITEYCKKRNSSLAERVEIFLPVCAAVDYAHQKGIVHRDLKPANVLVMAGGLPKLLDFGIAKSRGPSANDIESLTAPGLVVGTPHYMSPEQARGEVVDARSDIFSLGVMLYELVSGERPFNGETASDTITEILRRDPPRLEVRCPGTPRDLDCAVFRALHKKPEERYQTAGELLADLKRVEHLLVHASVAGTEAPRTTGAGSRRYWWVGAAVLLLALAGLWRFRGAFTGQQSVAGNVRFSQVTTTGDVERCVVTPNGNYVVYVDHGNHLLMRHLASGATKEIASGIRPVWLAAAPDNNYVYFVTASMGSVLQRIPVLGGTPEPVMTDYRGGLTFSPNGSRIAMFRKSAKPRSVDLITSAPDGGGARIALSVDTDRSAAGAAGFFPDGRRLVYSLFDRAARRWDLEEVDIDGQNPALRMHTPFGPVSIVHAQRADTLLVLAVDAASRKRHIWLVRNDRIERLSNPLWDEFIDLSVTADGHIAATRLTITSNLWGGPMAGPIAQMTHDTGEYRAVTFAPDGRMVVTRQVAGGQWELWLLEAGGRADRRLYTSSDALGSPSVCGDNRTILFSRSDGDSRSHIRRISLDRAGDDTVSPGPEDQFPSCASVSKSFVFLRNANSQPAIWQASLVDGQLRQLDRSTPARPDLSPDGTMVVYLAPGGKETVLSLATGEKHGLDQSQFDRANWSADSASLVYLDSRPGELHEVFSVPAAGGTPKKLMSFQLPDLFGLTVSRDSSRVVMIRNEIAGDIMMLSGVF